MAWYMRQTNVFANSKLRRGCGLGHVFGWAALVWQTRCHACMGCRSCTVLPVFCRGCCLVRPGFASPGIDTKHLLYRWGTAERLTA